MAVAASSRHTGEGESFGDQLRRYRKRAGLTQEELAERAGLAVNTISNLERGAIQTPFRDTVRCLGAALDLSADEQAAFTAAARRNHEPDGSIGTPQPAPFPRPATVPICPYRGLEAFDETHADLFHGREREIRLLLDRLRKNRFLAVLGPSGSGKSSLIRAGLIPALRRDALPGSAHWPVRVFTPGPRPLHTLATQLLALTPEGTADGMVARLQREPRTLRLVSALVLANRPQDERIVWVVDQCEEVFTLCHDENERRGFWASLLDATAGDDGRCIVIVSMRADFYHRCAAYPEVAERMAAHQILIGPMDRDGIRRAVVEPARMAGLTLEEGLVDTILDDYDVRQPGALPLLELSLLELWERRAGTVLTKEAYAAGGGVRGAIATRADALYDALSPAEQAALRHVLLRLVEPGEGTEDTRRRVSLRELATAIANRPLVIAVAQALVDARLLVTGDDERTGDEWVEITHEALIRDWPRLRRWIDDDRGGSRIHRRLTEAALDWDRLHRDEGLLYRGARLAEALEWAEQHGDRLNELERDFLNASRALKQREDEEIRLRQERELETARRLAASERERAEAARALAQSEHRRNRIARLFSLGMAIALVVALATTGLALQQRNDALAQQHIALSRELAVDALAALNSDPELSILLAQQAVGVADTAQAEEALREALDQSQLQLTLRGHTDRVLTADVNADGSRVLSYSADGTARLWNAHTGRAIAVFGSSNLPNHVLSAAFSPDGRMVATGHDDGTVRIWDAHTGVLIRALAGHSDIVDSLAFSPDSHTLLSASDDHTARLWDVTAGRAIAVLRGHTAWVTAAAWVPDGQHVITAGTDRTIRIWNARTGSSIGILRTQMAWPVTLAIAPTGHEMAVLGLDGRVSLWNVATLRPMTRLPGLLTAVAFSHSGDTLITGGQDQTVRIWDARTGRSISVLRGHTGPINSVAFSRDDTLAASASDDGTVRVWGGAGTAIAVLRGHAGAVRDAVFSPDGRYVVTAGNDHTVRIWATVNMLDLTLNGHTAAINDAVFSPDGHVIATASGDHTARLWDARTGRLIAVLRGHSSIVDAVAFSPNGRYVLTGGEDHTARLWDARTGRSIGSVPSMAGSLIDPVFSPDSRTFTLPGNGNTAAIWSVHPLKIVATLSGHGSPVTTATFGANGRYVLTAGMDGTIRLWNARTGSPIAALATPSSWVAGALFSPDGRLLLAAGMDGRLVLWDARTRRRLHVLQVPGSAIHSAAFSDDSRLLVTAGNDDTAQVWDARTGRMITVLNGHSDTINNATFSPDSRFVVTASRDRTARIWDTHTGTLLATLSGQTADVTTAVFSPDGRRILTAGMDGRALLYTCDVCGSLHDLLSLARTRVTRSLTPAERARYLHTP